MRDAAETKRQQRPAPNTARSPYPDRLLSPYERPRCPSGLQRPRVHRLGNLRRSEAHAGRQLRPRPRARRDHRTEALPLRPHLLLAEGRGREDLRHRLEVRGVPARHGAGERRRGDRHRPHLRLRRTLVLPAHHRADGIRRRRRPARPHRDAPPPPCRRGPVRRRPQARPAGAALGDRRHHQRARRGDPGHPHHHRPPLPPPGPAVAGAGAGRGRRRHESPPPSPASSASSPAPTS